jgi:hypothetical protein
MENKTINVQPLERVGNEYVQFHSFLTLKVNESKLFSSYSCFTIRKEGQGPIKYEPERLTEPVCRFCRRKILLLYRESNLGRHAYIVMCMTKTNLKI